MQALVVAGVCEMSIYKERFGLRPIINAGGTMTALGGSIMLPGVVEVMRRASEEWVSVPDLLRLAGEEIGSMLDIGPSNGGSVLITSGAAGANTLAAAAVITGPDPDRIRSLPNSLGYPNEIVIAPGHGGIWESTFRAAGARLIHARSEPHYSEKRQSRFLATDVSAVADEINEQTCALAAIISWETVPDAAPTIEDLVTVARLHGLPLIVDASAQIPPLAAIKDLLDMGVTLVSVSGGKALRGPNDTGLLVGSKPYVQVAARHASPVVGSIGRGFKVSKEQIVGLVEAIRLYLGQDEEKLLRDMHDKCDFLVSGFEEVPFVRPEKIFPDETGNPVPRVRVHVNEEQLGMSISQIIELLRLGDPDIRLRNGYNGAKFLNIDVMCLRDGEVDILMTRLKELLRK
tara:strand:- start:7454 stop:8662 length:1209 start_codon:yes stop_codon:yes gene_type:complete